MRVSALCGSLRKASYTRKALTTALEGAEREGAITKMLDLRDYEWCFAMVR